ncbi:glycosyltransferase [Kaarinaea lacus]
MTKTPRIEVLLAVYNNLDVTRLTLQGYCRQIDTEFTLVIADDGSGPEIKQLVDEFQSQLTIRHLWQEDQGFRKARILNRAIATSNADYLVFSDNDCIPSRHFVADHRMAAQQGYFITGRRVDLGPVPTDELLIGKRRDPESFWWVLQHSWRKNLKRGEKALRPPHWLHKLWSSKQIGTLGANMAMWRDDLIKINGFDETFEGYGMEEVDLEWRLLASGLKRRSCLGRAILYHLYHQPRAMTPENKRYLNEKIAKGVWYAEKGIEQLS